MTIRPTGGDDRAGLQAARSTLQEGTMGWILGAAFIGAIAVIGATVRFLLGKSEPVSDLE
jgi:hypothetical protein